MDPDILWKKSLRKKPVAGTNQKERESYRKKLLAGVPRMSAREIRRHQLKYCEAMFEELREDGFEETAEYINKLILFNEELRGAVGDESLLKGQRKLKDEYLYLEKLRMDLTDAEVAHNFGDSSEECWILLNLAIFFMNRAEHVWWLAEQLFLRCVEARKNFDTDNGRFEATFKYLYGRFLLALKRPEDAYVQLKQARVVSAGQFWIASKELGSSQKTIYEESCCLIVKNLLLIAEQIKDDDPNRAIRLCNEAMNRAAEVGHTELETETFLQLGKSQMAAKDYYSAIYSFDSFLKMRKDAKSTVDVCCAYLNLATCYKMTDDPEAIQTSLMALRDTAQKEQSVPHIVAADRLLGEFYMNTGLSDKAVSHLLASFSKAHQNKMTQEMEETRALAAVATGQGMLHILADHILTNDNTSIQALCRWKNEHITLVPKSRLEARHSVMYQFMHARSTSEVKLAKQTISNEEAVFQHIANAQS